MHLKQLLKPLILKIRNENNIRYIKNTAVYLYSITYFAFYNNDGNKVHNVKFINYIRFYPRKFLNLYYKAEWFNVFKFVCKNEQLLCYATAFLKVPRE